MAKEPVEKPAGNEAESELAVAVAAVAAVVVAPAVAPPRCSGPELEVAIVTLHLGDRVSLKVVLCQSAFRVRVHLDGNVILDQAGLADEVDLPLPPLGQGFHSLTWGFIAASLPWHTRSEVQVNGLVRFALNKGSVSNMPSNNLSLILEVL